MLFQRIFPRLLCVAVVIAGAVANAQEDTPRQFSGIYPSLAYFNNENECGTGAVVPWADRLWVVTYGPHCPGDSSDRLYEIDSALNRIVRPESVGGTNANRLIHRESQQLFIGNHAIDAQGNVRTIPHDAMYGRLTATARHLTDPENKVYMLTMEEGLYEVDVHTLEPIEIFKDSNRPRAAQDDLLPGYHGKGGYTAQGRVVYTNNGENSEAARRDPTIPSGALAQWNGDLASENRGWNLVRRNQFTEATGPNGIYGAKEDGDVLWTLGWDVRSVILEILDNGVWREYRLPKASRAYDGAHGWNTEWPRIRQINDTNDYLATMHGQFWRFPKTFSAENAKGLRPRSTYLKVVGDFCYWNDRVVLGCDDSAKSEFLNKSPFKNALSGPGRSNSNLWFIAPEKLDQLGPALGRGALWLNDDVDADEPSAPYLFAGYDKRMAFVTFDKAEFNVKRDEPEFVRLTFEVDRLGNGEWTIEREIEAPSRGGTGVWVYFDRNVDAEWIRVRCNASLKNATCFFQYRNNDTRTDAPSPIFNGLATVEDAANFLSARAWVRADNDRLAVVSQIIKNDKLQEERYYELSENAELERVPCVYEGGEAGTISRVKTKVDAQPLDSAIATIDDLSVCLTYGERKWRLPIGSDSTAKLETAVTRRIDREVATERDLFHYAGIFYELPAENAGGLPMIRPIATHNFVITDYASYRGLLVLSGVASDSARDSDHIVRSEDGQCALWLGAIDDLWSLGKPVGHGYVWRETKVAKDEPSDPFLATGFDRKSLVLTNHCDEDVEVTLQADATGYEHWRAYKVVKVKANSQETLVLHDDFGAFWLRCTSDKDATLSAEFIYN